MGDAAGQETTKAARITATGGDGASTRASVAPPVEEEQQRRRRRRSVPPPAAAAGVAATATATTGGSPAEQRCCGEEEEDDEQVERFYTLLANIRALRGLYSAGDGPMGGGAADGRGRKRAREAEEPWRPAFQMVDFVDEEEVGQVAGGARCGAVTTKQAGAAVTATASRGRPPRPWREPPATPTREMRSPKRAGGRSVAASQRAADLYC